MNPKNLEGKTKDEQKNLFEIELIGDFEMEYGQPDFWSEEIRDEFDRKWDKIQERFRGDRK